MSMQIHNDGIASSASLQSTPVQGVAQPGSAAPASSAVDIGADQVEISSLSGNIAASADALAGQNAARVAHLAALYAKGEYQVDSGQLSRALVSDAMAGGGLEEDN